MPVSIYQKGVFLSVLIAERAQLSRGAERYEESDPELSRLLRNAVMSLDGAILYLREKKL